MRVGLTFDCEHADNPESSPYNTGAIVDLLESYGVRATFFLQGRWVRAYPKIAQRIVERGHLIGSHSFYHAPMTAFTPRNMEADLISASEAIKDVTGIRTTWFRPPFGTTSAAVRRPWLGQSRSIGSFAPARIGMTAHPRRVYAAATDAVS